MIWTGMVVCRPPCSCSAAGPACDDLGIYGRAAAECRSVVQRWLLHSGSTPEVLGVT